MVTIGGHDGARLVPSLFGVMGVQTQTYARYDEFTLRRSRSRFGHLAYRLVSSPTSNVQLSPAPRQRSNLSTIVCCSPHRFDDLTLCVAAIKPWHGSVFLSYAQRVQVPSAYASHRRATQDHIRTPRLRLCQGMEDTLKLPRNFGVG